MMIHSMIENMVAQNAIVVTGCDHDDVYAVEIGEQK